MCPCGEDNCEYIVVCTDELLITSKDPKGTTDVLTNKNSFELKGAGPILHHLGCDFGRDEDGTLHFLPKNCSVTMIDCYYNMFSTKPKITFSLNLEKCGHAELETSEYLDSDGA